MTSGPATSILASMLVSIASLMLLTTPPPTTPPGTTAPPTIAPGAGTPLTLAGVVTEQGDMLCTGGYSGDVTWVNLRFEVGFVRVVESKVDLKPFIGKPVLVTGRKADAPATLVGGVPEGCPVPQMRSDMVMSKTGMRLQRHSPPANGFIVESVTELTGLTAKAKGDSVTITLKRPKQVTGKVTITVHYEGCGGKPGSDAVTKTFGPKQAITFIVPKRKGPKPHQRYSGYRADSVEISFAGDTILSDLDVDLSDLGAPVSCATER